MRTRTTERAQPIVQLGAERPSRQDLGDVQALAASMALEGLRHPVLLMPSGELLKGSRRLAAARLLGWSTIQTRTVSTIEEAAEALQTQRDETCLPRRMEEWVGLGLTIELLDWRERPEKGQPNYDTYQVVGPAVAPSGSGYKRGRHIVLAARSQHHPAHVVEIAQQCVEDIDAGRLLITTGYLRVRAAEKADPIDGLGSDGLPMIAPPQGKARSQKARKLREDWIRALVAKGATSAQIADRLGIGQPGLKKIASAIGVVITADVALNRTQRKAADPNRAVRVAIDDLDALVWSLDRVDVSALDSHEVAGWVSQLREHARSISRVASKMAKEQLR